MAPRTKAIVGGLLATTACVTAGVVREVLRPAEDLYGSAAQQAASGRLEGWLLGAAVALAGAGYVLLVMAWTGWRRRRRLIAAPLRRPDAAMR